jgi:hypothetical protein
MPAELDHKDAERFMRLHLAEQLNLSGAVEEHCIGMWAEET